MLNTTDYDVLSGAARIHIPAVGRRQILPGVDIPGTVGIVIRNTTNTYLVEVRPAERWMKEHPLLPFASVYCAGDGRWVAQINANGQYEGIGVYREVEAALGEALAQLALIGREDEVW